MVGAWLNTKLNLHLFSRLLRLPLDYFERHPAGETMYRVAQVYLVREFLTGQLLATFLDMLTLAVLLPFLFWLNAPLAWIVLPCAGMISAIASAANLAAFLSAIRASRATLTASRAVRRSMAAGLSASDLARAARSSWAFFASAAAVRRIGMPLGVESLVPADRLTAEPMVRRLAAGGRRIRTLGPPEADDGFRTAGTSADRGFRVGRHGDGIAARHQGGSA